MNFENLFFFLEIGAVFLAVAYLLLAVRRDIRCWIAGIMSSSIYFVLMFTANLYMESILQIFYIFMGVYGFNQWKSDIANTEEISITTWNLKTHLIVLGIILISSYFAGYILDTYTDAKLPFLDSLTTFGALFATYMVAKKILENWIYWFLIDSVSIYLFIERELYLTSILFCLYLIIIIFGFRSWLAVFRAG
tara:strand:+ start:2373 stop:2951 length:579 start_codon:yes stop_codon:yes gene_type:complete